MWYSNWNRHTLIVNGTIHWAGRLERKLGEAEDMGVQAPSLRNLPIVVAILQGHHPNSFFLQCELSAREIPCIQQETGTVEAFSFQTGHVCCQCWTVPAFLLTFTQTKTSSGLVRWITGKDACHQSWFPEFDLHNLHTHNSKILIRIKLLSKILIARMKSKSPPMHNSSPGERWQLGGPTVNG